MFISTSVLLYFVKKNSFYKCLSSVKAHHGHYLNIKKLVSVKDLKVVGLKSYDFHVLMQQLLPGAISGILQSMRDLLSQDFASSLTLYIVK